MMCAADGWSGLNLRRFTDLAGATEEMMMSFLSEWESVQETIGWS
jgi:hypothetical protein